MKETTTRFAHLAAAAMLAVAACGGIEGMDEMEESSESTALSVRERGTAAYTVRHGDLLFKLDRRQIEILRIDVRGGSASGATVFKSTSYGDEYKCDHDPPQPGDDCTCGGYTGPGSGVLNTIDCGMLKIDCADGAFDGDSCSDWDGDPLPPP